ncbi:MAG: GGDEF domain-containing protein [Pseudomonadota bacterium]|nr:GGDEF domain-containing protein [Pseudomonadota bacterium]
MSARISATDTLFDEATVMGEYPLTAPPVRRPVFLVLEGKELRRVHLLDRERTVVGRGADCDIVLEDAGCSRRHAAAVCTPGEDGSSVWLEDLGSTNGTFVNGERIEGRRELVEHDRVRVGATLLCYNLRDDLELDAERHLIQLATIDPLTGLMNRGAFDQALEREFDRAVRYGRSLSLLLVDIDHFKYVNDTWGHPVGDRVLAQVAHALRGSVRNVDVPGRYGGEEFAVILSETNTEGAAIAGERVRHAIGALVMAVGNDPVRITASVGVVTWSPLFASPAELVAAADQTLYRAKRSGRNRTVVTHL